MSSLYRSDDYKRLSLFNLGVKTKKVKEKHPLENLVSIITPQSLSFIGWFSMELVHAASRLKFDRII